MNKYSAKKVWLNIETNQIFSQRPKGALSNSLVCFDSQFEYKCYRVLRKFYLSSSIELHYALELKSKTLLSSKIDYIVDFAVTTRSGLLCVEAKGLMTRESKLKLKMLEVVQPFLRNSLVIVSEKSSHYFGKRYPPSLSIIEFEAYLKLRTQTRGLQA